MKKRKKIFLLVGFLFVFFLLAVSPTILNAQDHILPGSAGTLDDEAKKYYFGNYTLDDFLRIAVNFFNMSLGVIGSLALLMFVYGGFVLLTSGGSEEKVKKGKDVLLAAIIGLFIVFGSYLIVDFTMKAVGVEGAWGELGAGSGWFKGE